MDDYRSLLKEAFAVSSSSTCLSRKVGAIIFDGKEIVSKGFNDTPNDQPSCGDGGCYRCRLRNANILKSGELRDKCNCVHAEISAINELPETSRKHLVIFVTIPPCTSCAQQIASIGIACVIFSQPTHLGRGIRELARRGVEYRCLCI